MPRQIPSGPLSGTQQAPISIDDSDTDGEGSGPLRTPKRISRVDFEPSNCPAGPSSDRKPFAQLRDQATSRSSRPTSKNRSSTTIDLTLSSDEETPRPSRIIHFSATPHTSSSRLMRKTGPPATTINEFIDLDPDDSTVVASSSSLSQSTPTSLSEDAHSAHKASLGSWGNPVNLSVASQVALARVGTPRSPAGTGVAGLQSTPSAAVRSPPRAPGAGIWGNPMDMADLMQTIKARHTASRSPSVPPRPADPPKDQKPKLGGWGNPVTLGNSTGRTEAKAGTSPQPVTPPSKRRKTTAAGVEDTPIDPALLAEERVRRASKQGEEVVHRVAAAEPGPSRPLGSWGNPAPMATVTRDGQRHAPSRPATPPITNPREQSGSKSSSTNAAVGSWGNFKPVGPAPPTKRNASPPLDTLSRRRQTAKSQLADEPKMSDPAPAVPAVQDTRPLEAKAVGQQPVKRNPTWATRSPSRSAAALPSTESSNAPARTGSSTLLPTATGLEMTLSPDSPVNALPDVIAISDKRVTEKTLDQPQPTVDCASPARSASSAGVAESIERSLSAEQQAMGDTVDGATEAWNLQSVPNASSALMDDRDTMEMPQEASTATVRHAVSPPFTSVSDVPDPIAITGEPVTPATIPIPSTVASSNINALKGSSEPQGQRQIPAATNRASPAPSSSSSIQEIDRAGRPMRHFSRSPVPEFRSVKPSSMDTLQWLRLKAKLRMEQKNSPAPSTVKTERPLSSPLSAAFPPDPPAKIHRPIASQTDRTPQIDDESDESKMSREEWRRIVDEDGASDVEIELALNSSSPPSSGVSHDRIELGLDHARLDMSRWDDPTQMPPPERRGTAKREFDNQVIDQWNSMFPKLTPNAWLHREMFEMYILTRELESGAITVVNNVDLEGAPPDMEFEYSNEMIYDQCVPDPEKGLGCGCDGPCDPLSRTCSCVRRQELYFYGINNLHGFAYDENGKVQNLSVPIWECGETCGCPPECMNRVIQRGRSPSTKLEIVKTRYKGWGVQAGTKIPRGTFIGIYAGEMITEADSEARGELYSEIGRTYIFDLDGWQIRNPPAGLRDIDPRLAEIAEASAERARLTVEDAGNPNYVYNAYSVDAFHYGYTRYINHSCDPNLEITQCYVKDFHPERPMLVIFARRDIESKEELCISYKGVVDDEDVVEPQPLPQKKTTKKGKKRQSKTSASAHVTLRTEQAGVKMGKNACLCGAKNCDGKMFNL